MIAKSVTVDNTSIMTNTEGFHAAAKLPGLVAKIGTNELRTKFTGLRGYSDNVASNGKFVAQIKNVCGI